MRRSLLAFTSILTAAFLIGCSSEAPTSVETIDNSYTHGKQTRTTMEVNKEWMYSWTEKHTAWHSNEIRPICQAQPTPTAIFEYLVVNDNNLTVVSKESFENVVNHFDFMMPTTCLENALPYTNTRFKNYLTQLDGTNPPTTNMFHYLFYDEEASAFSWADVAPLQSLFDSIDNIRCAADIQPIICAEMRNFSNYPDHTPLCEFSAYYLICILEYWYNADVCEMWISNVLGPDSLLPEARRPDYNANKIAKFSFCGYLMSCAEVTWRVETWENGLSGAELDLWMSDREHQFENVYYGMGPCGGCLSGIMQMIHDLVHYDFDPRSQR